MHSITHQCDSLSFSQFNLSTILPHRATTLKWVILIATKRTLTHTHLPKSLKYLKRMHWDEIIVKKMVKNWFINNWSDSIHNFLLQISINQLSSYLSERKSTGGKN